MKMDEIATYSTEKAMLMIVQSIATMEEVQSIGISGGTPFPRAGEGDIDVFMDADLYRQV